jgi:hypothetical protein
MPYQNFSLRAYYIYWQTELVNLHSPDIKIQNMCELFKCHVEIVLLSLSLKGCPLSICSQKSPGCFLIF